METYFITGFTEKSGLERSWNSVKHGFGHWKVVEFSFDAMVDKKKISWEICVKKHENTVPIIGCQDILLVVQSFSQYSHFFSN